jgi:hypothetical protein
MSIRLSERHGVNPAIPCCYFCGKEKDEIVLFGRLKGDVAAPRKAVLDKVPCDECAEYMKKGIILISVENGWDGKGEPFRTGRFVVVKEDALRKVITNAEALQQILRQRVSFVQDEAFDQLFGKEAL